MGAHQVTDKQLRTMPLQWSGVLLMQLVIGPFMLLAMKVPASWEPAMAAHWPWLGGLLLSCLPILLLRPYLRRAEQQYQRQQTSAVNMLHYYHGSWVAADLPFMIGAICLVQAKQGIPFVAGVAASIILLLAVRPRKLQLQTA